MSKAESARSELEPSLDSNRLTARSNSPQGQKPLPSTDSERQWVDITEVDIAQKPIYRSVDEGESRKLETVQDAIDGLEEYCELRENDYLILERENEGEKEVLNIPYNHRWKSAYRDMMYAKLKSAERALKEKFSDPVPTTLLTLTISQTDAKGEPLPYKTVLDTLQESWEKFRDALRRAVPNHADYEYLRMIEPHESGYPHIHVAIFGVTLPSLADKVNELWVDKYDVGKEWGQDVSPVRGRSAQKLESPASYCMKYLQKTTVRESGEMYNQESFQAFSAVLWATGTRQLSMSEWLSKKSKDGYGGTSKGKWAFVGVYRGVEGGHYVGDVALEFLECIHSDIWKPPPAELQTDYTQERLAG